MQDFKNGEEEISQQYLVRVTKPRIRYLMEDSTPYLQTEKYFMRGVQM